MKYKVKAVAALLAFAMLLGIVASAAPDENDVLYSISGKIINNTTVNLQEVYITIENNSFSKTLEFIETTVEEDGSLDYAFDGLTAGTYSVSILGMTDYSNYIESDSIITVSGDTAKDFTLTAYKISGSIINNTGTELFDVQAFISGNGCDRDFFFDDEIAPGESIPFSFNGLPPGIYSLDFYANGENFYEEKFLQIRVKDADIVQDIEFVRYKVYGKIKFPDSHENIEYVELQAFNDENGDLSYAEYDEELKDGNLSYELLGLSPGKYTLEITWVYNDNTNTSYIEREIVIDSADKELNLNLSAEGKLSGTITVPAGYNPGFIRVSCDNQEFYVEEVDNSNGSTALTFEYELEGLIEDATYATIQWDGVSYSRLIDIKKNTTLNYKLGSGTLSGSLIIPSGITPSALKNVRIYIKTAALSGIKPDDSLAFSVDKIACGEHEVNVSFTYNHKWYLYTMPVLIQGATTMRIPVLTNITQEGGSIDYDVDAKNYSISAFGQSSVSLNLYTGELIVPKEYVVAGYSIDGGMNWKKGALDSRTLTKLFDKGMSLILTNKMDGRDSADDALEIMFPDIEKRPAPPKVVVNYSIFADKTGATNGNWTLTEKGSSTPLTNFEIALTDGKKDIIADKETGLEYGSFPKKGISVPGLLSSGKQAKVQYFVRTPAIVSNDLCIPPSKPAKVKVGGIGKAPNAARDYKNEIIKGKADLSVYLGAIVGTNSGSMSTLTKATAKSGVDISSYLDTSSNIAYAWTAATDKKPASAKAVIMLSPRADISEVSADEVITFDDKGKPTLNGDYEVKNGSTWGKLNSTSKEIVVRKKSTARSEKSGTDSGTAASLERTGVIEDGTFTWTD